MDKQAKPPKFPLESMDVADAKRQQLKQLFPEAFTEARDVKTGEVKHAVDWEKLKAALGEVLEREGERFGLSWPGKSALLKVIQQPSVGTLKPCREESVKFDETENLFIEGDNLEVLKLLQKSYFGKVKMIYIDPPYNTGNEFVYPDNFTENLETYLQYTGMVDAQGRKFSTNAATEGRFHSKWLNMMYPRLFLAKNLLNENGLIIISIDENEIKNLRTLTDEIFGEENFVECITWKKRYGAGGGTKGFARLHEYLLVYSKIPLENIEAPLSNDQISSYSLKDEKFADRGGYVTQPLSTSSKGERSNLMYDIHHEGKVIKPKAGTRWIWSEAKFLEAYKNDEIVINESASGFSVRFKQYLRDENGKIRNGKPLSIKSDVFNQEGTGEVAEILGKKGIFDFPKPSKLLSYLFSFIVNDDESTDGVFLDFFSGSCSSAQAVIDINKVDGGNRKFIMVQLPEPCDEKTEAFKAGYKTIADIGKERIRRVIQKIKKDQEGQLDLDSESKPQDLGFKVFKLSESNFNTWQGDEEDPAKLQEQLEMHVNHVDPSSTPEDILYELLLKAGFPLTTKVEKISISDKSAYSIAEGALIICLDDDLTKPAIQAIAALKPVQCICLDAAFHENDQLKTNAVQTMEAAKVQFRTV